MSINESTIQFLESQYFFSDMSKKDLSKVAKESKERIMESGQFLFKQSEKANFFYYLKSGKVKLTILSADGNEKVIDIIREGHIFAEGIVLGGVKGYPVNAEIISASEIICIHSPTFREILLSSPVICMKVMKSMSKRLHFLIKEVDRLSLHNASYRLISYLLEQAEESGDGSNILLSIPKHTVASRISVKPETFSRILKQLSKTGMIEVKSNNIKLINIDGLKNLIEIA